MFSSKTHNRLIAVLLVLVMTVSCFPYIGVAAADTATITITGTGSDDITVTKEVGETINLAIASGLPYKDANGKFLTFVDGAGNVLKVNDYEVSADATLTATYQNVYAFITGEALASYTNAASATTGTAKSVFVENFKSTKTAVTKADGYTYCRFESSNNTSQTAAIFLDESQYFQTTTNGVTLLDYETNYDYTNLNLNNARVFVQWLTIANNSSSSSRKGTANHQSYVFWENGNLIDGVQFQRVNKSFNHSAYPSTDVYGYRIAPYGGTTCPNSARINKYFDIKYIASFESETIANAFDFDRYMGYIVDEAEAPAITITVKDTDGTVIDTVEAEEGEVLDLLTLSGLAYKNEDGKFLTFEDESGNLLPVDNYTVSADATLTATYQNVYALFKGAEIYDIATKESSRVHFDDATYSSKVIGDTTYFHIASSSTSATGFGLAFKEGQQFEATNNTVTIVDCLLSKVSTASVKFTLQLNCQFNPKDSRIKAYEEKTNTFYEAITIGDTTLYHMTKPLNHELFMSGYSAKYSEPVVRGYRIGPWGFNGDGSDYYCDIKYMASFDNEEIANTFDFDKYMTVADDDEGGDDVGGGDEGGGDETTITITIKNTDGTVIETLEEQTIGTKLDLLALSDLVYRTDDGKFLTFVDDAGKVHGVDNYEVSATTTLKATYQTPYGYYSGQDLVNLNASRYSLGSLSLSSVSKAGKVYARLTATADNSNVIALFFNDDYSFTTKSTSVTVIDFETDYNYGQAKNNDARTFLQYLGIRNSTSTESKIGISEFNKSGFWELRDDGLCHFTKKFSMSALTEGTEIFGYRFAPWGGRTDTALKEKSCDIRYIASFDTEEIADAFDFDKYYNSYIQGEKFDINFKDVGGKTITFEDVTYGTKITAEEIKANKPYGFITQYFEGDKLYVLSGWTTEGVTNYDLDITSSDTTEYTAVYKEAVVFLPADFEDETLSVGVTSGAAGQYGIKFYSDVYRRDYMRMYDDTTGTNHHAFKLDWNLSDGFSVDTNVFTAAAVLSTTNAAASTNPRQAFKLFTGNASASSGGQDSVYFNYESLKNGDVWSGLSTFELPANVTAKGIRFMPFAAQALANTDTGYGVPVYSDVEFIGFFANSDAAAMFDIREYRDVTDKETKFFEGDTNGDGKINSVDFVLLSRYLANWKSYDQRIYTFNSDLNKDTFITSMDATILMRRIAGWTVEDDTQDDSRYYLPNAQPSARGGSNSFTSYQTLTSDLLISTIYEPLREAHPDNITRENIGKDESGKYDMWCYTFTPDNFDPDSDEYYTVFISAGSHGMTEAQSYLGLARLMQLVWDDYKYDNDLAIFREKVRFVVIPLVNVWDVSERVKGRSTTHSPYNSTNTNLNRNWLTDSPQKEVANIRALIYRKMDEGYKFDFGFDFHTDPEGFPGWGSYLLVYPYGVYDFFSDRLKEVCAYLDYKNFDSKGIVLKDAFRGDCLNYPQGSSHDVTANPDYPRQQNISTCASVLWSEFGIPSATLEHGSRKFGDQVFCSSDDITAAVELYANQILQQLNYDLKEKVAIAKGIGN